METIAVIDFETTGLAPSQGARATEVAAVLVREGRVVDRYSSLMRSGAYVPPFIEQLTGISNQMLRDAPPAGEVMREVLAFTRGCARVAHNARFDEAFWSHERALALGAPDDDEDGPSGFSCTMLLSRRLYPECPNHRLGTLAAEFGIDCAGRAHRALADAEVTAQLWLRIVRDVERRFMPGAGVGHALLRALQRSSRGGLARCVREWGERAPAGPSAA